MMNEHTFNEVVKHTRLSDKQIEAAKLVLVEGKRPGEAAESVGTFPQQVSRSTKKVLEVEQELLRAGKLQSTGHQALEKALDVSYTLAVQQARERCGEGGIISIAEPNRQYVGEIVSKSDMHVVQNVGRDQLVIHESAKLERVPTLGSTMDIRYGQDLRRPAQVQERANVNSRGGLSR
ncbi:TrfB-related DNA-binding protein [Chromobacterium piscinae]|uniref:KfrB domain-containing protein n=1 Tax=Chromobacterium piscinae TaxID=686831 RepID=UPI001E3D58D7|nr:TrfB-related DNA-binding protein [Chromobacterium piscinae]MCD5327948.1 transcriptional regulator KorA [Chromobacterium piscinae]